MFSLTSRLNKLSLCYRFSAASSQSTSSSSSARKVTLEQSLGIGPKPKKPLSAFFRFVRDFIRPNLIKDNPNVPVTHVTKVAALQWKEVDENLKNKLKGDYQRDMEQYRVALKGYEEELSKVDKEILKKLHVDTRTKKEKNEIKKQRLEFGCPKRPLSTFFLYLQKRKAENPNRASTLASNKDFVRLVSEEWRNLDPTEKAVYKEMQAANKIHYAKEMELWERGMRETGNAHLISPTKSQKRPRSQ